jgi:hypothetical protein
MQWPILTLPCATGNPTQMAAEMGLRRRAAPGDAGYCHMADAIDLALFD